MIPEPESASASGADVIVVVNPNNPTGRLLSPAELRFAAGHLARIGGLLVVDEAFIDVLPSGASVVPELPPATIVLRSFGKTYGLAGLRLGFAIGEPAIISRIRGGGNRTMGRVGRGHRNRTGTADDGPHATNRFIQYTN